MKPYLHARSSSVKYGGKPDDYMDIHDFMDSTKSALADVRHRAVLHSAFGIYLVEKVFGQTRTNSDNRVYSIRDIAEDHVKEDLGFIPSMETWLRNIPIQDWMMGKREVGKTGFIPMKEDITIDGGQRIFIEANSDGIQLAPLTFPNNPPLLKDKVYFD